MLPYVYLVRYGRTVWGRAEGAGCATVELMVR
jgi:hypothetical protein